MNKFIYGCIAFMIPVIACIVSGAIFTNQYAFLGQDCVGKDIILKKNNESIAHLQQIQSSQIANPLTFSQCRHLEDLHSEDYPRFRYQFIGERMRKILLQKDADFKDIAKITDQLFDQRSTTTHIFLTLIPLLFFLYLYLNRSNSSDEDKKNIGFIGTVAFLGAVLYCVLLVYGTKLFPGKDIYNWGYGIFSVCFLLCYTHLRQSLQKDGVELPELPQQK